MSVYQIIMLLYVNYISKMLRKKDCIHICICIFYDFKCPIENPRDGIRSPRSFQNPKAKIIYLFLTFTAWEFGQPLGGLPCLI